MNKLENKDVIEFIRLVDHDESIEHDLIMFPQNDEDKEVDGQGQSKKPIKKII